VRRRVSTLRVNSSMVQVALLLVTFLAHDTYASAASRVVSAAGIGGPDRLWSTLLCCPAGGLAHMASALDDAPSASVHRPCSPDASVSAVEGGYQRSSGGTTEDNTRLRNLPNPPVLFRVRLDGLQKDLAGTLSRYEVTNEGSASASVVHEFFDERGTLWWQLVDTIPAARSAVYDLAQITWLPPGYRGYVIVSADQPISARILSTPDSYTVSGRVIDGAGNAVAGVSIAAGGGRTTTTDLTGEFTLSGLAAGVYELTPSKSNITFSPASRVVNVPPNKNRQDFVAVPLAGRSQHSPLVCAVPWFSQKESRWRDHPLRTAGECQAACSTIGACGCTLTSASMVFAYYGSALTPATLSDCIGSYACSFRWAMAASCTRAKATWENKYSFDWGRLDHEINHNRRPVILGMHKKDKPADTHWVVVTGGRGDRAENYYMHDPWFVDGANQKLSLRADGAEFDWLAVYSGTPHCIAATSGERDQAPASESATQVSATTGIHGTVLVHSMTGMTVTVQLIAHSDLSNIAEMQVWTDAVSSTTWQPFQSLVWLPVSDIVYARFRDYLGRTSEVSWDTIYPTYGPPTATEDGAETYLPVILYGN
jgi:hypothetical protein